MGNKNMTIDEATLLAYIDGELDAKTAREVEQRLADDGLASEFVRQHREISALARISFNDLLHEDVPETLPQTLRDGISGHGEQAGHTGRADNITSLAEARTSHARKSAGNIPGKNPAFALPLAAAIAGLVLGLGGGFGISEKNTQSGMQLASAAIEQNALAMNAALDEALEMNTSGSSLAWSSESGDQSILFTPIKTYKDKSGKFCREYRKDAVENGEKVSTFGLACRDGDGKWATRYLIFENGDRSL